MDVPPRHVGNPPCDDDYDYDYDCDDQGNIGGHVMFMRIFMILNLVIWLCVHT